MISFFYPFYHPPASTLLPSFNDNKRISIQPPDYSKYFPSVLEVAHTYILEVGNQLIDISLQAPSCYPRQYLLPYTTTQKRY